MFSIMADAQFPDLAPEVLAQITTGPNLFALEWVAAVLAEDVEVVWAAMSDRFRLALAQLWIHHTHAGGNRDELATRFLHGEPDSLFREMRLANVREIAEYFGGVHIDELAAGSRPRPIGVDLEMVRLFYTRDLKKDDNGHFRLFPGTIARAFSVIVSGDHGGWQVEGVGHDLLRPGWPPVREQVVGPTD